MTLSRARKGPCLLKSRDTMLHGGLLLKCYDIAEFLIRIINEGMQGICAYYIHLLFYCKKSKLHTFQKYAVNQKIRSLQP